MGLYKRKDSRVWWMSFTADGKLYRKSTETGSKDIAKRILKIIEGRIAEGKRFEEPQNAQETEKEKSQEDVAMVEVIDRYMREVSTLKPGSHERNKQIVAHFRKFFGGSYLKSVSTPILSKYKAERLQTLTRKGTLVAADTVRKELSLLRQIFNVAIEEWELLKENPVGKVIKSLPKETKRVRYVLPEEAEKLRFTIPSWLRPIVIVACQTGLRRENIVNLTVAQLDFDTGRIIVSRTKNGEPIGVAMTSVVRDTLREVIRTRKVTSPYVFCDKEGKRYSPYKVSMAFKRACGRAGVENLRLHDLRHDFATLMLKKRKNLVEVQHALGHKDPRMTLRYAHLLPEDLKEAFEAIDGEGTASVISRFLHVEEKEKELLAVTP